MSDPSRTLPARETGFTGRSRQLLPAFNLDPRSILFIARGSFIVLLAAAIFVTPGFFLAANILSILVAVSFIGCVAVGMTLITISGNLLSFSLGITTAASAMLFVASVNRGGTTFAIAMTLAFGVAITGVQGFVIGFFRSHPIIVSIATLALITGLASPITQNESFSIDPAAMPAILQSTPFGVPIEFVILLFTVVVGQCLLSFTSFGRCLYMIGSSIRAAESAGITIWQVNTASYALTGLFTALAGILLAAHYQMADMEYARNYDYDAIAAVLVGGTPIQGGQGSVIRTLAGVAVVAIVQSILLLQGLHPEWQYLITGTIVLAVIMLHMNVGKR